VCKSLTRLPFSYGEADRVVAEAVAAACWQEVGALAETSASARRPAAQYRLAEKQVQLYGRSYRAIVVHSSAHDKRRLKAIERQIAQEADALTAVCRRQSTREYFCRADAEAEAQRLHSHGGQFHRLETAVVEKLRHPPGRPPRDRPRPVASVRYLVQAKPEPDAMRIARQREEAGCFVLLSNVPEQGPHARTGPDLLHAYKDTLRPTTFMMTTKFAGLQIVRIGQRYRLAQPLRHVQAAYLRALNFSLDELLSPPTGPP